MFVEIKQNDFSVIFQLLQDNWILKDSINTKVPLIQALWPQFTLTV